MNLQKININTSVTSHTTGCKEKAEHEIDCIDSLLPRQDSKY